MFNTKKIKSSESIPYVWSYLEVTTVVEQAFQRTLIDLQIVQSISRPNSIKVALQLVIGNWAYGTHFNATKQ